MSEVDHVREGFVQLWGAMGPFWGISPTTARVFAWLLSQPQPADTEEIMEGCEISRGAASMACRELRDWGLLFPEKSSGSRRIAFRPATDFEKVIRNIVETRKRREWDPIRDNLQEWLPLLEADPSPDVAVFHERLRSIESLIELTDSALRVFLSGGLVGRLGLKLLVNAASEDRAPRPEKVMQLEESR